jgi:hypothetical protein
MEATAQTRGLNWYAVCLNQGMYAEVQTKKLAQAVLLFSLLSLCAVFLCMAVTARHNAAVPQTMNFPVYTYQNPFTLAGNDSSMLCRKDAGMVAATPRRSRNSQPFRATGASPPRHKPSFLQSNSSTAISGIQPGGILTKLISARFLLSLSGLAVLWLASSYYLNRGGTKQKRVQGKVKYADTSLADKVVKMNPLATVPKKATCGIKQDSSHSVVICAPLKRCSSVRRKTTVPCQSRFRPLMLISSQTRLGRFKLK